MMNRVEMNEEMMTMVNGGGIIPIVDQNEMIRIPEKKTFWDEVWDDVTEAWDFYSEHGVPFVPSGL